MAYTTVIELDRFVEAMCGEVDPTLRNTLTRLLASMEADGLMLLECQMLDSSRMGERVALPFGGKSTYKTIPTGPISPRGLASDMSSVVMVYIQ